MSTSIAMNDSKANPTGQADQNPAKQASPYNYPQQHWNTVYIDDKFYMAHPLQLDKLLKLQTEIKKEKNKLNLNLNQNLQSIDKDKILDDRNQRSELDNYRPLSGLSRECKTEINELKEIKSKIKAENELVGEEERYQQRLAEIKKKKQSKQTEILGKELRESSKKSEKKSGKEKSGFEQGVIIPQELNNMKRSQASEKKQQKAQKSQSKKQQKQKQKPKTPKSPNAPQNQQKNYISFHPNDAITSPKFEMNKTKTAKFADHQHEVQASQKQKSNMRYSANNTSKLANKSFVVNLRKTPSNSKEPRESLSNSRRELKSASSAASRIQLETLNKKIKEMQDKLATVQLKQREFEEVQRSRVLPLLEAYEKNENMRTEEQKMVKAQNERYNEQLQQTEQTKHKLQKSGRLEFTALQASNKSSHEPSAREPSAEDRKSKESQVFDLTIYRTKKLNLASQTVAYNYSEDWAKMKKEIEEVNQKEKMAVEIGELKRMIRELKLQRIRHEAVIEELERKDKEKDVNVLLNSKLDQGSPQASRLSNIRLPTQKRQKTQPKQPTIFEQTQSPKEKPKRTDLRIQIDNEQQKEKPALPLKKVDSSQSPIPKKQKLKPLRLQSNNSMKQSNKFESTHKIGINSKELFNTSSGANPEESSYREFHPYPLNRRGIVVRQVLDKDKDEKMNTNQSIGKNNSFEPPSPVSTGRKIFQLQFIKQTRKKTQIVDQQPDLTPPALTIRAFPIPKLPEAPTPDINQTQLLALAKYICNVFSIRVESDDHIYMKKYKNCIIFKTPDIKRTVVWHYSGKFYIGGWDQNQQGEGKKNGEGFQFVPEKHYYQGQFLDGKKNGSGTMVMLNGNIYKGQWVKGQKEGFGTYYEKATDAIYQGQWKEDKKDGKGILKISDNEFYDGTFVKSIKHGYGLELFNNGDYYKGEYKIGRFHGKGRYAWKNGASYDGNFVDGRREGMGRWKSSKKDYDIYFGEYKNDKKSGKGQYTWNNGTVYEGHFINDLKHGEGRVEYPDGREIRGYWDSGKLVEVDQNIEESQTSSHRNEPLSKPLHNKILEISSKELQPSRKLTKL